MKNFKVWHLAVICVAVFLIFAAIAAAIIISNDEFRNPAKWSINFDEDDFDFGFGIGKGYSIDKTETINVSKKSKISVNTISSDVNIYQTDGSELIVHLYGDYTSRRGEIALEIQNTGSTTIVTVKYPKGGVQRTDLKLDIQIPSGYSDDLSVNGVSSDVTFECEEMMFSDVNVSVVSGTTMINTLHADGLFVNTVSGDVKGRLPSGELDVNGVSAKVTVSGLTETVSVNTVSGDVTLFVEKYNDIKINTTSGDSEINLESKDDFYVKFDSVSGDFECNVPLTIIKQKNSDFEGYSGTDNSAEFNVDSVSGDLTINQ